MFEIGEEVILRDWTREKVIVVGYEYFGNNLWYYVIDKYETTHSTRQLKKIR